MSATKVSPTGTGTTTPRSVRSVLDVVMLVGLFLVVVADGVAQGLEGAIIPPVLVLQALYLLCGVVVATGWRWSSAAAPASSCKRCGVSRSTRRVGSRPRWAPWLGSSSARS